MLKKRSFHFLVLENSEVILKREDGEIQGYAFFMIHSSRLLRYFSRGWYALSRLIENYLWKKKKAWIEKRKNNIVEERRCFWRILLFPEKKIKRSVVTFLYRERYYFFLVISMRSGEAIQIDEYVPTTVPKSIARVNHFKLSGPKKKSANRTINTVEEVRRDRPIVSWIDLGS